MSGEVAAHDPTAIGPSETVRQDAILETIGDPFAQLFIKGLTHHFLSASLIHPRWINEAALVLGEGRPSLVQ
jgi:hypothetical protein